MFNHHQATFNLATAGRQVLYPCTMCSETFRWQSDLYKHYATQHFYDELLSQLTELGMTGPPYKCPMCPVVTDTEKQILIHYGLTHRAVQKLLEKSGALTNALTHRYVSNKCQIFL